MRRRSRSRRLPESLETRALLSTITVTSLDDNITEDGEVTLREAIEAANTDTSVDGSAAGDGADTIVFADGLLGKIELTEGTLVTEGELIIKGASSGQHNIEQTDRSIDGITGDQLQLERLTFQGGDRTVVGDNLRIIRAKVYNAARIGIASDGGDILIAKSVLSGHRRGVDIADGSLRVVDSSIIDNKQKADDHRGLFGRTAINAQKSNVEIIRSTIAGNTVDSIAQMNAAWFFESDVWIENSTISNNIGGTAGITITTTPETSATIINSTVTENDSVEGAIRIFEGDVRVSDTIIAGNIGELGSRDLFLRSGDLVINNSLIGNNDSTGLAPAPPIAPDANGNIVGTESAPVDPLLDELVRRGTTSSHLPLSGSPVIDAAANKDAVFVDQYNRGRLAGSAPDIGARETADVNVYFAQKQFRLVETNAGQRELEFEFTLTDTVSSPLVLNWTTVAGTAEGNSDYIAASGQLTFNAWRDTQTITVQVNGDTLAENEESFAIRLTSADSRLVSTPGDLVITLRNSDRGFNFTNGEALFLGTGEDDVVNAAITDGLLVVDANGTRYETPANQIDKFTFVGVSGDDQLTLQPSVTIPLTADGGSGNDTLTGGSGDDEITGERDSDVVTGGDGNDTLFGFNGSDWLDGGDGDDVLDGYRNADTIIGGPGNDTILAGSGQDLVDAGAGDDFINSGPTDPTDTQTKLSEEDTVFGRGGDDTIFTGKADDSVVAGSGNDSIDGGDGWDTVFGEEGEDTIRLAEQAGGGQDNDFITLAHSDEDRTAVVTGGLGDDTITDSSGDLAGNDGDDTIIGEGKLDGGAGNDVVTSAAFGADSLFGGDGNDTLDGGPGNDTLFGDDGDDVLIGGPDDFTAVDRDLDRLYGGRGDDSLRGGSQNDALFGQAGNDTLIGGDGHDQLYGHGDDDVLDGNGGQDLVVGGQGSDSLTGGAEDDLLVSGSISKNEEQLQLIFDEWASDRTYRVRSRNLVSGNGSSDRVNENHFLLGLSADDPTVVGDTDLDILRGRGDVDWFFAGLGDDIQDRDGLTELFSEI